MGKPNFRDEFKRDAVTQITERGYPVAEVSQRLGVSTHSLYAWKRQFAKVVSGDAGKDAEIRQLKREMARVTEERDILKKRSRTFVRLCGIETGHAIVPDRRVAAVRLLAGSSPLKNVVHGTVRT